MSESRTSLVCRLLKDVEAGVTAVSATEALEFRRDQYGLSKSDWCFILDIRQSHYSEILNGKRTVPLSLVKNANAVGVPLLPLVHGNNHQARKAKE